MGFCDDVHPETEEAPLELGVGSAATIAVELRGHDAALLRELERRLGMPARSVVKVALLGLAGPRGRL
jgi:hypothetical protein